ncbi:MAG TPA: hypothetical protein VL563_11030 [Gemmatimonadales bacterium]|jgi:hypothetical protein|nr:hypothetical protein [Gemmatimonadales bacterium]
MIRILPPSLPEGPGIVQRLARSLPDLGLGALFLAAWLNLLGLGARFGIDLMLLIEIEGTILLVTLFSAAMADAVVKDKGFEKVKSFMVLLLLCIVPPILMVVYWRVWWPVGAYGGLLWNRLRAVSAGPESTKRLRMPLRELLLFALATFASMWLAVPALGSEAAHFRIADFPGWCHVPEYFIPEDLREGESVISWCAEPHRALASGTFYYLLTGLWTISRGPYRLSFWWGWIKRQPED